MFFVRRERIWMIRSTSFVAADQRVELPLGREGRQVARVLGEERELLLLLGRLALLDERDRLLSDPVEVEAVRRQEARRDDPGRLEGSR